MIARRGLNAAPSTHLPVVNEGRRRLLGGAVCSTLAPLCGAALASGCGGDGAAGSDPRPMPALVSGTLTLSTAQFPELSVVGGSVIGVPAGASITVMVVRASDTQAVALQGLCTHMSCPLRYNSLNQDLECACHGSNFEIDGSVSKGPAVAPLATYPVTLNSTTDGTTITVTLPHP